MKYHFPHKEDFFGSFFTCVIVHTVYLPCFRNRDLGFSLRFPLNSTYSSHAQSMASPVLQSSCIYIDAALHIPCNQTGSRAARVGAAFRSGNSFWSQTTAQDPVNVTLPSGGTKGRRGGKQEHLSDNVFHSHTVTTWKQCPPPSPRPPLLVPSALVE